MQSKTFCILPWVHMATFTNGDTTLCCVANRNTGFNLNNSNLPEIWNSQYYKDVRKKMLSSQKVSACSRCYEEEKNTYKSHRIVENEIWLERLGKEKIKEIVGQTTDGEVSNDIMSLDLRLGNTCNLKCVMCRPQESSKWLKDSKILSNIDDPVLSKEWSDKSKIDAKLFEWYKIPEFWEDLVAFLPNIQEVVLAGGEPLLIKEQKFFLEKAIETGHSKHILLRYHTNGTVLPNDVFDYWKHFMKVDVSVSLDSIEEKNYWIRYPANWNDIEENLEVLDNSSDNISVSVLQTIQFMNIYYVPEFIQWIKSKKFQKITKTTKGYFHPGLLIQPPQLNVRVLPKELKEKITKRVDLVNRLNQSNPSDKLMGTVNYMNSQDWSHLLPITIKYINALDKIRGTNFYETFNEISDYFKCV